MNNRPPTTPGEMLLMDFLKPAGISQCQLAKETGLCRRLINEVIKGKRGITGRTAILLSGFFNTTPEFWMNLQVQVELYNAQKYLDIINEGT